MAKLDEIQAAIYSARDPASSRRYAAIAAYRRVLQRRYEYAAAHPWFPMGPDPPTPEFPD
jgi:hypothetical protein